MYWMPKTRIGKLSFWIGVSAFALMHIGYWISMLLGLRQFVSGFLSLLIVLVCGVTSVIALTKYRDRAILLFLSALTGLLALVFIFGEIFLPH